MPIMRSLRSFEVLFVSQMDVHQARTESTQEEMKAKMDIHQEKMEAAVHSIRSELEETVKHWVEDVLSCVNQKTQGFHKELIEKIDETQVTLQAVKTPLDTQMNSLQETLADMRKTLHKELSLMLQVETQTTKAKIGISVKKGWKPRLRPPDASSRHS
jgi:translation elongation factor EF-G